MKKLRGRGKEGKGFLIMKRKGEGRI